MEKLVLTITKVVTYLFMASAVIFMAWIWYVGDEALENDSALANQVLNPNLTVTYIALILTAAIAIILPLFGMLKNPKQAIKGLIVLAVMAIVGFITYSMATNQYDAKTLETLKTTAETSRMVGASLYFTYIIGVATIAVAIFSGISGATKKV